MDIAALLLFTKTEATKVLGGVLAVLTLIAAIDYTWQIHSWKKKQRMTIKEVKDEMKNTEGDPLVRGKIRQIRSERGRQRMMAKVPKASVILNNPTHYSVALQYDSDMSAPVCVAKGVDQVALKIRQIGEEHDIPQITNAPLARALYASVELDDTIPEEHFKAVAQVIGYVMNMKKDK